MDKSVPKAAAKLLAFISGIEAPLGYDTIYGNNQRKLKKQITKMTIKQLVVAMRTFTKSYGSSASGHYQIMRDTLDKAGTLEDLVGELGLTGDELFDADMQDRLAFHLLKRRGYEMYMAGKLSRTAFGLRLAKEWASLPVLATGTGATQRVQRGQSYYAGDALNRSLVKPEKVEAILDAMKSGKYPMTTKEKVAVGAGVGGAVAGGGAVIADPSIISSGTDAIVDGTKGAETVIDQITPITDTVSLLGYYGPWIAGGVIGLIVLAAVSIALYKWAKQ